MITFSMYEEKGEKVMVAHGLERKKREGEREKEKIFKVKGKINNVRVFWEMREE